MNAYTDEELDRLPDKEARKVTALFTLEQTSFADFTEGRR